MKCKLIVIASLLFVFGCGKPSRESIIRDNSGKAIKSWDLILTESDLAQYSAYINPKNSSDSDLRKGEARFMGAQLPARFCDSRSDHQFKSTLGDIKIELTLYRSEDYAKQQMDIHRTSALAKSVKSVTGGANLRKYKNPDRSETIEENPFYSKPIDIVDRIGEETFCSQWKTFSPELSFRLGAVYVELKTGDFGIQSLPLTIEVAKMQEAKLRRLLYLQSR